MGMNKSRNRNKKVGGFPWETKNVSNKTPKSALQSILNNKTKLTNNIKKITKVLNKHKDLTVQQANKVQIAEKQLKNAQAIQAKNEKNLTDAQKKLDIVIAKIKSADNAIKQLNTPVNTNAKSANN